MILGLSVLELSSGNHLVDGRTDMCKTIYPSSSKGGGGIIKKGEMVGDFERIINGSALFVPANKWVIPKGFFSGIYTVIFEGYLKVRLYFILLYLRHYLI